MNNIAIKLTGFIPTKDTLLCLLGSIREQVTTSESVWKKAGINLELALSRTVITDDTESEDAKNYDPNGPTGYRLESSALARAIGEVEKAISRGRKSPELASLLNDLVVLYLHSSFMDMLFLLADPKTGEFCLSESEYADLLKDLKREEAVSVLHEMVQRRVKELEKSAETCEEVQLPDWEALRDATAPAKNRDRDSIYYLELLNGYNGQG